MDVISQLNDLVESVGIELTMCYSSTDLTTQLALPETGYDGRTALAVFKLRFAQVIH